MQHRFLLAATYILSNDAVIRMPYPFGELNGAKALDTCYAPLLSAMPDLERRIDPRGGCATRGEYWLQRGALYGTRRAMA